MNNATHTEVVEIDHLTKSFDNSTALNDLTMQVHQGEVHGFLGPNGAGKSTTIRVLLGLMRATSGSARVFGLDPWTDTVAIHSRIAYVPGDVSLWPNLTGGEVIDLLCRMRGTQPTRKAELIERFDFDPTKKGRTYSKGNRQKVAIIAAFAADADFYVLDEPTSGLDPLMERQFQDALRDAMGRGATALLSSHILSEVEKVCDRISIVRDGQIVDSGTMAQLRHLTRTSIHASVDGDPAPITTLTGVHDLQVDGSRVSFDVDDVDLPAVLPELARLGVTSLTSQPPSLEDIFMRHYDRSA